MVKTGLRRTGRAEGYMSSGRLLTTHLASGKEKVGSKKLMSRFLVLVDGVGFGGGRKSILSPQGPR